MSCGSVESPPWTGVHSADAMDASGSTAAASRLESADLEQLMLGYQAADREAAGALIRELSPKLLRFLAGPRQTRPYADDMLQECWLRIHRARHTYRPGTPVLPWIFAIARHTRVDVYRRRRRIDAKEMTLEQTDVLADRATESSREPDVGLWRLVEQLPEGQQEVIRMLKIAGMSLEEVARATGSSVGAVKQKAHRAYEKLRVMLQDDSLGSKVKR